MYSLRDRERVRTPSAVPRMFKSTMEVRNSFLREWRSTEQSRKRVENWRKGNKLPRYFKQSAFFVVTSLAVRKRQVRLITSISQSLKVQTTVREFEQNLDFFAFRLLRERISWLDVLRTVGPTDFYITAQPCSTRILLTRGRISIISNWAR